MALECLTAGIGVILYIAGFLGFAYFGGCLIDYKKRGKKKRDYEASMKELQEALRDTKMISTKGREYRIFRTSRAFYIEDVKGGIDEIVKWYKRGNIIFVCGIFEYEFLVSKEV